MCPFILLFSLLSFPSTYLYIPSLLLPTSFLSLSFSFYFVYLFSLFSSPLSLVYFILFSLFPSLLSLSLHPCSSAYPPSSFLSLFFLSTSSISLSFIFFLFKPRLLLSFSPPLFSSLLRTPLQPFSLTSPFPSFLSPPLFRISILLYFLLL